MHTECRSALHTQRMPTTRNEEYRFTDVGPLLQIQPKACSTAHHIIRSHLNRPDAMQPTTAFPVITRCHEDKALHALGLYRAY